MSPMPASSTLSSSGLWWENSFSIAANDAYVHAWLFCSVIGLPGEEDWPRDVALPRQAFHSKSPQPIEKFVTDIDEQGKDLLLVSSRGAELVCTGLMRDVTCPLGGLVSGGRSISVASLPQPRRARGHSLSAAFISIPAAAGGF